MADFNDLKRQLKEILAYFDKVESGTDEKYLQKKLDGFYAYLKNWKRVRDPKIITSCLGPSAVLSARFYTNQGVLEIHDHRGHLISIHGDVRLQIGGYAMDVDQKVRDELSGSGLVGEELIRRNLLKRWVD